MMKRRKFWSTDTSSKGSGAAFPTTKHRTGHGPRQWPRRLVFLVLAVASLTYAVRHQVWLTLVPYDPTPVTLFYNMFLPDEDQDHAIAIFREQLDQIADSYAHRHYRLKIRHLNIGAPFPTQTWMAKECSRRGLNCESLGHHPTGFEDVTLQHLYDHCQANDGKAIYMHSKGSFHANGPNDNWRWHMTAGVVSQDCLTAPNCDVCGLNFCPRWGAYIIAGNFWAANCEYVRKLLAPKDYDAKLGELRPKLDALVADGRMVQKVYNKTAPWNEQVERYIWEMWPVSHPDLRPCDLSWTPALSHWFMQKNWPMGFVESAAPRHSWSDPNWHVPYPAGEPLSEDWSMRDYFLLGGHLVRWYTTYGKAPPADSWVWNWYPDGAKWKQAVADYGKDAVERMLKKD